MRVLFFKERGSFIVIEFFFCFCPSPLLSLDLFRCWKFWAGLRLNMFTCRYLLGKGNFCVAATDITDSKAAAARKREKGKIKHKSKIAVRAVVVIGDGWVIGDG